MHETLLTAASPLLFQAQEVPSLSPRLALSLQQALIIEGLSDAMSVSHNALKDNFDKMTCKAS